MLLNVLIAIVLTFLFSEAVGFLVHKLAHWPGSGKLFRDHLHHHSVAYPPTRYMSSEYLGDLKKSFFPVFIPVFLVINAAAFLLFSWPIALVFFVVSSAVSVASAYLHDSFHIENHRLAKYAWHRKLSTLHLMHHKHTKKNLGIYMFLYDRLTGSFKRPKIGS